MAKFCMYVTPASHEPPHLRLPGYLCPNDDLNSVAVGPVVRSWKDKAIVFESIEQVNACIRRYGWLVSTSVRPGWTTAYAAEWVP